MATIGLDTSVVVRLLTGLPSRQAAAAKERLEQALDAGDVMWVTDLVIAEAYHALHHHYDVPRNEAQKLLLALVTSGVVQLDPGDSVSALAPAEGVGLVDRLIHARHRARGAVTLTFDRRQAKLEGAETLTAQ